MKKHILLTLSAVLISACAQTQNHNQTGKLPGAGEWYRDGEQYFYMTLMRELRPSFEKAKIPRQVRSDLASCMWLAFSDNLTPAERREFDAAATGEGEISGATLDELENRMDRVFHVERKGDFTSLEPYCPDTIPEFKSYVQ